MHRFKLQTDARTVVHQVSARATAQESVTIGERNLGGNLLVPRTRTVLSSATASCIIAREVCSVVLALRDTINTDVREQLGPELRARDFELEPKHGYRRKKEVVANRAPLELHSLQCSPARIHLLVEDVRGALNEASLELRPIG